MARRRAGKPLFVFCLEKTRRALTLCEFRRAEQLPILYVDPFCNKTRKDDISCKITNGV